MIDPVSAFGLIVSAHKTLKKCVEMGKDLSSATTAIQNYARGEAELGFGKERKKIRIVISMLLFQIIKINCTGIKSRWSSCF